VDVTMPDLRRLNPGVVYSVGRFGCFLAVATVLWLIGFRSWLLVLGALILSAPLSYVLLRGVRSAWSQRLEAAAARRKAEKQRLRATLRGDEPPAA
jgi:ABC-type spermidine/putrescine transport system permease subunit II